MTLVVPVQIAAKATLSPGIRRFYSLPMRNYCAEARVAAILIAGSESVQVRSREGEKA